MYQLKYTKKVQVGNDQEKAQSEKDSNSKNRSGIKLNQQSGIYTIKLELVSSKISEHIGEI